MLDLLKILLPSSDSSPRILVANSFLVTTDVGLAKALAVATMKMKSLRVISMGSRAWREPRIPIKCDLYDRVASQVGS